MNKKILLAYGTVEVLKHISDMNYSFILSVMIGNRDYCQLECFADDNCISKMSELSNGDMISLYGEIDNTNVISRVRVKELSAVKVIQFSKVDRIPTDRPLIEVNRKK